MEQVNLISDAYEIKVCAAHVDFPKASQPRSHEHYIWK
jgi:hypothetical protein